MTAIELTQKNLNNLTQLEFTKDNKNRNDYHSIIYRDNQYIYKIIDIKENYPDEFKRNINFLINNNIPNIGPIIDKIYYKGTLCGYVAEYVDNSILFRDAIFKDIDEQDKISAIIGIHRALKYFHENNIILGEICLDHFLISGSNGYIIDLEYIIFPGDEYKFKNCYNIKKSTGSKCITTSSKYTDIIKAMIASLSLLLKMDLESLVSYSDNSINLVITSTRNRKLLEYFDRVMNKEELYFDDFLVENNYYRPKTKTS